MSRVIDAARESAARSVNAAMTAAYWLTGRRIIEFEQSGAERAEYGTALLERLSEDLTGRFGRGFSRQNVQNMRLFYLAYPPERIRQTLSGKLIRSPQLPIRQTPYQGEEPLTLQHMSVLCGAINGPVDQFAKQRLYQDLANVSFRAPPFLPLHRFRYNSGTIINRILGIFSNPHRLFPVRPHSRRLLRHSTTAKAGPLTETVRQSTRERTQLPAGSWREDMELYQFEFILHEPEERHGGMYRAEIPTLQGCRAWGDTPEETLEALWGNARILLQLQRERAEPLPPAMKRSKRTKGIFTVTA